jgi:hypothetical protein
MGIFSSGKKYKKRAEAALAKAEDISDYQEEQDFRRGLLSNIRRERIARAQLEVANYSTTASTSSAQGALANIDSAMAGDTYYSYASSDRAQQIQDYTEYAQQMYQKYQKQQKKRATAFSVAGTIVGAATGGITGGVSGAVFGSQIGQGVGQIASGTGTRQTSYGIQNILGGVGSAFNYNRVQDIVNNYYGGTNNYTAQSLDSNGNVISGSTVTGSLSYIKSLFY